MPTCAVIFDFDGVIASTEDLHLQGYNHALSAAEKTLGRKIFITPESYGSRYIVYGSRDGFIHMLSDVGIIPQDDIVEKLCNLKNQFLESQLGAVAEPLPGIRPLLKYLSSIGCLCAICSGARRVEIKQFIGALGLEAYFCAIVSVDDVQNSKPDPEGYLKTYSRLKELRPELTAEHVMVIEDTRGGASAAKAAGLRVIGVATTSRIESVR
ncbi:MAG: HAD family hydrolase, partial [Phycisphaerae bacterium]